MYGLRSRSLVRQALYRKFSSTPRPSMTQERPSAASQKLYEGIQENFKKTHKVTEPADAVKTKRRETFRQALVNGFFSFAVVVLAAQSYKSGHLKVRAETRLDAALEVVDEQKAKLKTIQSEEFIDKLARTIVQEQTLEGSQRGRFKQPPSPQEEQARVAECIHNYLNNAIGDAALDRDEADKLHMAHLGEELAGKRKPAFRM